MPSPLAAALWCLLMVASVGRSHAQLSAEATDPPRADTTEFAAHRIIRATARTVGELRVLQQVATELLVCEPHVGVAMQALVTPEQHAAIESAGIATLVEHPNAQEYLDASWERTLAERAAESDSWFTAYKTYAEFNALLDHLALTYPDLAQTFVVGTSIENRPIRGIRFTGPDQPGNPRRGRPALLLMGGQHAREWVNPATTIYAADAMLERYATDARIREVVDQLEIIVVPITNPDGYVFTWAHANNRFWRKNRRATGQLFAVYGVDPNRNWGFQWGNNNGSDSAQSGETYRGAASFSEPEIAAMRDFVVANPHIHAAVDIHTAASLLMWPWGYSQALCEDDARHRSIGAAWTSAIRDVFGQTYVAGPVYTTIYPVSGGALDWWYGARGILAYTIELRSEGFAPPATSILPNAQENLAGFLTLAEQIIPPVRLFSPAAFPEWIPTQGPNRVAVMAQSAAQLLDPTSVRLFARTGSQPFAALPLTLDGETYSGETPIPRCGQTVDFYFEARSTSGSTVRFPPTRWFTQRAAESIVSVRFNGEQEEGWSVGLTGDLATMGRWERGVPESTAFQSGADSDDAGSQGWFTGLASGAGPESNDVDGGATTLRTPEFSTKAPSGMASLRTELSFWWWFATNSNATIEIPDTMKVELDQSPGVPIDTFSGSRLGQRFTLLPGFDFVASSRTRLRFVVNDRGPDTICEGGVDDLQVFVRYCRRSADVNNDRGVTIDDLLQFLFQYGTGQLAVDYSNDDAITIDDLLIYLEAYSEGI